MADYYVKCVNEDADDTIEEVGYGQNVDNTVADTKSKDTVISDIDSFPKQDVMTAYYSSQQGEWVEGDEIHTVDGQYIRTDGNNIQSDNLENLSSCPDEVL